MNNIKDLFNKKIPLASRIKSAKERLQQQRAAANHIPPALSTEEKHYISLETAQSFLETTKTVWNVALLTLPLDYLLFEQSADSLLPPVAAANLIPLFVFLASVAVTFSFREAVLHWIRTGYRTFQQRPWLKFWGIITIIGVSIAALVVELILHSSSNVFSALIQFLIYGAALYSLVAGTGKNHQNSAARFRTFLKRDYFIASLFPIVAARLMLPVGILALQISASPTAPYALLALYALTILALLELNPGQEHFLTRCPRCSILIPLRLLEQPACLHCQHRLDLNEQRRFKPL